MPAGGFVLPVPRLVGPTTELRPWRVENASALADAWNDPEIQHRLNVPDPCDEAAAARWIAQRERAWAEGRSADLAVADRQSGTVIGEVGLSNFDPLRRAALAGWWIAEGWRGRGRAGEAVRLVVDWALSDGPLEAVMAEIDADNLASMAVARRAGMRLVHVPQEGAGVPEEGAGVPQEGAGVPEELGRSDGSAVLVFARTRHADKAC